MNARKKLNVAYLHGALVFSAVVGLAMDSWPAFLITLGVLLAAAFYTGDIRPTSRR